MTGLLTAAVACLVTGILMPSALPGVLLLCLFGLVLSPLLALAADAAARARTVRLQSSAMAAMARLLAAAPDLEANGSAGPVLARQRALEAQASAAAEQVADLVEARAGARESAREARKADLRHLQEVEAERDRITELIRRRAAHSAVSAAVDGGGWLTTPTQGWLTSPFGWRTHPIFGYRALHDGQDIGAPCGTPVVAPADGTVLSEYYSSSYGNRLIIDHGLQRGVGLATISNHLSGYAVGTGAHVERGQVIGYVGTTGWSTGCHLHFTVLQNGVAVDPAGWL